MRSGATSEFETHPPPVSQRVSMWSEAHWCPRLLRQSGLFWLVHIHRPLLCRYDDILVNGLPDWRQPVFYYRRVRKMSNTELGFLLFLILTVGHYAIIWSIYFEKQLVRQPIRAQLTYMTAGRESTDNFVPPSITGVYRMSC